MSSVLHGFGINDSDYITQTTTVVGGVRVVSWRCPFYSRWVSMIQRCYSLRFHKTNPRYLGCSVCKEWLTFSKFREWMDNQDWEGKDLDKDVIIKGNKIYSPCTCSFIHHKVNTFLLSCNTRRGFYKVGCSFVKHRGKFRSYISNPFIKGRGFLLSKI